MSTATALAVLEEWLGRRPRVRVDIGELWNIFLEAEPWEIGEVGADERLLELLLALAERSVIRLPGPAGWDRGRQPAMPRRVTVVRATPPPAPGRLAGYAWRPELSWVTRAGDLGEVELEWCAAVQAFLATGGEHRPVVPVAERSLELFGDEKLLDVLVRGRLFAPGRLTLRLLGCAPVALPLHVRRTGGGPDVLVVENVATWSSLVRSAPPGSAIGRIVWGQGASFVAGCTSMLEWTPRHVWYAGDLDPRGLMIPQRTNERLSESGAGPVHPCLPLYRMMLAAGRPRQRQPVAATAARSLAAWLGPALEAEVAALLAAGRWIPQETVGYEQLRTAEWWELGGDAPPPVRTPGDTVAAGCDRRPHDDRLREAGGERWGW